MIIYLSDNFIYFVMACFIKFWLFIDFLSYKFLFSQVKLVFVYWLQV